MSAEIAAAAPAAPVRLRRAGRAAHARPRVAAPSAARPRDAAWVHLSGPSVGESAGGWPGGPAPSPVEPRTPVARLALAPAAPPAELRYHWTERGLAVLIMLIVLVALLVVGTAVSAFLAVSPDAPAPVAASAPAGAAAPLRAG